MPVLIYEAEIRARPRQWEEEKRRENLENVVLKNKWQNMVVWTHF